VAEDGANERAAAGADGGAEDVPLEVVLFLNDLAFFDFHIFAALAVGLSVGLLDGDDAHLYGNEAAIHFDGTKREIHVRLATKQGKVARFFHGADDAVDACAGGEKQLAPQIDGFGDYGNEWIAVARNGAADPAQEREVNLRALYDLMRLGVGRGRDKAKER